MTFSLDICMLIRLGQVHVSKFKVTGNSQEEKKLFDYVSTYDAYYTFAEKQT